MTYWTSSQDTRLRATSSSTISGSMRPANLKTSRPFMLTFWLPPGEQHARDGAAIEHRARDGGRVAKTRAAGREVDRSGSPDTDGVADLAGNRGRRLRGGGGGADDQVYRI